MTLKILVVDDSAFMRKAISEILASDPELSVVGKATDGADAVIKAAQLEPDVITMDINMPEMDGIEAVKKIMKENPRPIIMVSSQDPKDSNLLISALEAGAIDFIVKPSGEISLDITSIREELIRKVKSAASARVKIEPASKRIVQGSFKGSLKKLLVIGTSTGGPQTLERIIPLLPKNIPAAVLVVQHMPAGFTKSLAERLDKISELHVKEAEEGEELAEGTVYIAPGDYHMEISRTNARSGIRDVVTLNKKDRELGVRPCINVLMRSVAPLFKDKVIGVVLTGMGSDGTEGAKVIKQNGGTIIVQDKESSIIYGMPRSVVEKGCYDEIVALSKIPVALVQVLEL